MMNGGKGAIEIAVLEMLDHCCIALMDFNNFTKTFAPCGIKASDNAWARLGRYVATGSLYDKCDQSKST